MKWGLVPVGTVTATTIQSEGSIDGEERGLTTLCTVPLAYTLAAQANFIPSVLVTRSNEKRITCR